MVKFTHLICKEAENNKRYVKYVFWKLFKKLCKTIKEYISSYVTNLFFTGRALKGHFKGTQGTRALETLGYSKDT